MCYQVSFLTVALTMLCTGTERWRACWRRWWWRRRCRCSTKESVRVCLCVCGSEAFEECLCVVLIVISPAVVTVSREQEAAREEMLSAIMTAEARERCASTTATFPPCPPPHSLSLSNAQYCTAQHCTAAHNTLHDTTLHTACTARHVPHWWLHLRRYCAQ